MPDFYATGWTYVLEGEAETDPDTDYAAVGTDALGEQIIWPDPPRILPPPSPRIPAPPKPPQPPPIKNPPRVKHPKPPPVHGGPG